MEARDYRNNGLFDEGVLKGMVVSVFVHVAVFLLVLAGSWLMPPHKVDLPLCTVSLLTLQDIGGGGGEGEEGASNKGNGEPKPSGGSEEVPSPPALESTVEPEREAPAKPESEKTEAVHPAETVKETVPLVPIPKKVKKPVEKPKTRPKPKLPQKQQTIANAEPSSSPVAKAESESPGAAAGALSGHGEGAGSGNVDGPGKGHSGEGAGAGSGVGAGGGGGPYNATFGSGDGPRFVRKVLPRYPRFARELGKEGTVLLLVTIDELGHLVDVKVVQGAGSGFDEEALQAVKKSTFSPAKQNGKPVLCKARLPILFQLKEKGNN